MNDAPLFRSKAGLIFMVVAGLLLVVGLTQSASQPTPTAGPPGSSYATDGNGSAALVDLLEANGYDTVRELRLLADHPPAPEDVLVIINGGTLTFDDQVAIADYLYSGGRVVSIGSTDLYEVLLKTPHGNTFSVSEARVVAPVLGFQDVREVRPIQAWEEAGSLVPVVATDEGVVLGVEAHGDGLVVALADDSIVSNRYLGEGDHAMLALLAIGEPDGVVRFVEYVHGFSQPTGLSALPTRWKQALVVLAAAGLLWLVARGRRFGPAEDPERDLAPPRSTYVDALAVTLGQSKDPEKARSLNDAIFTAMERRGIDTSSSIEVTEEAVRAGVDAETAKLAFEGDDARSKAILLSHLVNKEQL